MIRMRHRLARGAAVLALVTVLAAASAATAHSHEDHGDTAPDQAAIGSGGGGAIASASAAKDLIAALIASARFHNVENAVEAGYEPVFGCLYFPDGYMHFGPGAMGQHYYNPELFGDTETLDPTRPELVVYEPGPDGRLRLTAVEWAVPIPEDSDPPVMFGREMMWHPQFNAWALHAWLWKPNPYGLFADVNPRVTCEHSDDPEPRPRDAHEDH